MASTLTIKKAQEISRILREQKKQPEDLDSLVVDASLEAASAINNEGLESQITYLLINGWTAEDIFGRLKQEE